MLKKVLTTAVLGISALGVMTANATAPGVYVTGQLGYAKTGKTNFDMSPIPFKKKQAFIPVNPSLSDNGLAGRLALGYQFNQHFAVEMGYLQLHKKQVDNTRYYNPNPDSGLIGGRNLNGSASLQQHAIDLVGKGILPVSDKLNVYGKLGVAYLTTTVDGKYNLSNKSVTVDNDTVNIAKHKFAPEVAVGVSYDITRNVSVDGSWTHIQPLGNKRPGNIDFVAVGLGYSFG